MRRRTISALLTAAILLGACGERAELDRQMMKLCAVDGGSKVYERVLLPKSKFNTSNNVRMEDVQIAGARQTIIADDYVLSEVVRVIKAGDPLQGQGLLQREQLRINRRSDGKLISERVQYRRSGGDGFHLGHHTTTVCPSQGGDLVSDTFKVGGST